MRTIPTMSTSGTAGDYRVRWLASSAACSVVPSFDVSTAFGGRLIGTVASGLSGGQGSNIYSNAAPTPAPLNFSAEL